MAPLPWPKQDELPKLPKPPAAFLAKVLEVAANVHPQKVTKRLLDAAGDRSAAGSSEAPRADAPQHTVPRPKTPPNKPPLDENQLKVMVDTVWQTMRGIKGAPHAPSPQRRQHDAVGSVAAAALAPVKQVGREGIRIGKEGLTPIKQLGRSGAKAGRATLERSKSFGLGGAKLGKHAGNLGKQGLGAAGGAAKQLVHQVNERLPVRRAVRSLSFPQQRKKAIPLSEAAINLDTRDAAKEVARGSGATDLTTDRGSSSTGTITPSGIPADVEGQFVEIFDEGESPLRVPVEAPVAATTASGTIRLEVDPGTSRASHSREARRQEAEKWGLRPALAASARTKVYEIEE